MGADRGVPEVEEEEDEEEFVSTSTSRKFVWDANKGCLVDAEEVSKATAQKAQLAEQASAPSKEPPAGDAKDGQPDAAPADGGEGEEGSSEEDDEESEEEGAPGEVDTDTASRMAFVNEASTPELIQHALSVGGQLADSVRDRWVLDQKTQLHFRHDSGTKQMHCWNKDQGYMYLWKGRGKLVFLSALDVAGNTPPAPGGSTSVPVRAAGQPVQAQQQQVEQELQQQQQQQQQPAAAPETRGPAAQPAGGASCAVDEPTALWATVLPPSVLVPKSMLDPSAVLTEELEVPSRALGHIIGKENKNLKELETYSGCTVTVRPRGDEETHAHLVLEGTKDQIATARLCVEQKLVMAIGEKKVEKLHKHQDSQLLEKKRTETGAEAAVGGVEGLSQFAEKWKLRAVIVRKLRKLDAMLQRYLIRHFKPWKAKPENALRSYVTTLLMHPQRWRLEALYEDGELDGDVCETAIVSQHGAVIGLQKSAMQEILGDSITAGDADPDEQFIELDVDSTLGPDGTRLFGDVQPRHCNFVCLGGKFYAMALESRIGTIVDGRKFRREDGPVPLRDGSVLAVGKYLIYCEVGTATALQDRRQRILSGESFWKIVNRAIGQKRADGAEEGAAQAAVEGPSACAGEGADDQGEQLAEAADPLQGEEEDELDGEDVEDLPATAPEDPSGPGTKRKRNDEEDALSSREAAAAELLGGQ